MAKQNLSKLLKPKRNELSELQRLCKDTKKQIDDAVEQGNNALLSLQDEYNEIAEKKRQLLRDVEKLEGELEGLKKKINYAENTYGKYLEEIKGGKENEKI